MKGGPRPLSLWFPLLVIKALVSWIATIGMFRLILHVMG